MLDDLPEKQYLVLQSRLSSLFQLEQEIEAKPLLICSLSQIYLRGFNMSTLRMVRNTAADIVAPLHCTGAHTSLRTACFAVCLSEGISVQDSLRCDEMACCDQLFPFSSAVI